MTDDSSNSGSDPSSSRRDVRRDGSGGSMFSPSWGMLLFAFVLIAFILFNLNKPTG